MSNQIAQIRENPFLQYFLGLHEYLRKDLFDPSMMVHFRKRTSVSKRWRKSTLPSSAAHWAKLIRWQDLSGKI
jgi:hypothetical protein